MLAAGGANLCVIGDPDQAIYGFRGADRSYFLAFQAAPPRGSGAAAYGKLPLDAGDPRRSGAGDLGATPQANAERVQGLADFAEQVKLDVYHAPTDRAEAEYVVHQIEQMVGGTSYFSLDSGRAGGETPATARSFADFAVLYRLGAQSRLLIEAFDRSGIPYQTTGQAPLQSDPGVRASPGALCGSLRNPRSRLHWPPCSLDGRPPLGADMVDRVLARLPDGAAGSTELAAALRAVAEDVGGTGRERLLRLAQCHEALAPRQPVARMVERVGQFLQKDGERVRDNWLRIAGPCGDGLTTSCCALRCGTRRMPTIRGPTV